MRVQVARIGKPHGIRGEVTVQVLTDAPQDRFVPGAEIEIEHATLKTVTVESARWNKDILLLAFAGILDRNQAETIRGSKLFIDSDTTEDEDDDAWYEHELEGLSVRVDGVEIGRITALRTGNAQDLLVIETTAGDEVYLPFVHGMVPEVDVKGGFIVATPPVGLFDVNKSEAQDGK